MLRTAPRRATADAGGTPVLPARWVDSSNSPRSRTQHFPFLPSCFPDSSSQLHARLDGEASYPDAVTLSLVIPALNEAVELPETLRRARLVPEVCEIILVDGGSRDGTPALAAQLGCKVIASERGRGLQLRAGAAQATGDVVVLLHADTWLPPETGRAIADCLRDARVVGGGCYKVFREPPSWLVRGSRFKCWWRLLVAGRVMGDQAMFIHRDVLEQVGGVPDVPLMEEFELCRLLRARGRLALADATVVTSARRFAKLGVLRTYARMWHVTLLYHLGKPLPELRKIYERE